jgi:hypothetical protein
MLSQSEYLAELGKLAGRGDRKSVGMRTGIPLRPDKQELVIDAGLHIACVVPDQNCLMQPYAEMLQDWIDSATAPANRQITESRPIERDILTTLAAHIAFERFRLASARIGRGML